MVKDAFLDERLQQLYGCMCGYLRQPITIQQHRYGLDVLGYCCLSGKSCLHELTLGVQKDPTLCEDYARNMPLTAPDASGGVEG